VYQHICLREDGLTLNTNFKRYVYVSDNGVISDFLVNIDSCYEAIQVTGRCCNHNPNVLLLFK